MFDEKYLNEILEANKPQAKPSKTVRLLSLFPYLRNVVLMIKANTPAVGVYFRPVQEN
jgi:hypothetical protein